MFKILFPQFVLPAGSFALEASIGPRNEKSLLCLKVLRVSSVNVQLWIYSSGLDLKERRLHKTSKSCSLVRHTCLWCKGTVNIDPASSLATPIIYRVAFAFIIYFAAFAFISLHCTAIYDWSRLGSAAEVKSSDNQSNAAPPPSLLVRF